MNAFRPRWGKRDRSRITRCSPQGQPRWRTQRTTCKTTKSQIGQTCSSAEHEVFAGCAILRSMRRIDPKKLSLEPFSLLDDQWALLVGGVERPNPMTVSWGGFGTLWNRPVVTVYVRPTRHTFGLLAKDAEFTLNFLPEQQREALDLCGSTSGRDTDKWAEAGLTPEPSVTGRVPRVAGARLAFECRILAHLDFDPKRFLERSINDLYPKSDVHRAFFGEVLAALKRS